ncbi:MAG: glycosyltransferase family protein [Planctomycetota bacterium]
MQERAQDGDIETLATIFYGLAGEGRGHATRACTIVEALRQDHRVVLFAPEHGYEMLRDRYDGTDVEVCEIEGLCFRYDKRGRLAKLRTGWAAFRYLCRLPKLLRQLKQRIEAERPALCLTDFDPALPRACERMGVPYLSVDHQHFLLVSDLSELPRRQRKWADFMSFVVKRYYKRQAQSVVSSFYFPKLKEQYRDVVQTGVLLRKELLATTPTHGEHFCVYLRRFESKPLLDALVASGIPAHVYGLGERKSQGEVEFRPISESSFVDSLSRCAGLITTAGNQLVGEALWLEKPVLAMPEPGNEEQAINAWFVEKSGAGLSRSFDAVTVEDIQTFQRGLETFRKSIDRQRLNGNDKTLETIRQALAEFAKSHAA